MADKGNSEKQKAKMHKRKTKEKATAQHKNRGEINSAPIFRTPTPDKNTRAGASTLFPRVVNGNMKNNIIYNTIFIFPPPFRRTQG